MTTLPGFMARVWRRPVELPPMVPADTHTDPVEAFKRDRRMELKRNGLRKFFMRHPRRDWTVGCVAVTDAEIREIWSLVPTGARIVIQP